MSWRHRNIVFLEFYPIVLSLHLWGHTTPFAVHYEKIRNHLRETAINSANIH